MSGDPWLSIIGIGEDGMSGLSQDAIAALENADKIIGGERHHGLAPNLKGERIAWPSPFDVMLDLLDKSRHQKVAILATGDPLWYSVGTRIIKQIAPEEVNFYPQLSAFQWASVRMKWSLADCDCVTVHGRAVEQIIPYFAPNARLLVLTKDRHSPAQIAKLLKDRGFGKSRLTVLAHLGGAKEQRFEGLAESWTHEVPDFHTLAVECVAGENAIFYGRMGGLPDDAFKHDGQMTKRIVRAATISSLRPFQDALLWDIGAGCGSVAIEWMRAARGASAIAIEPNDDRLKMMAQNAIELGVPKLVAIKGKAPEAIDAMTDNSQMPDAIFIGGGITSEGVFEACWQSLKEGGRLVANAVTLQSEARLLELHEKFGGTLDRVTTSTAIDVGKYSAMKPSMSVMQWAVSKPYGKTS